jgi:septal ring factor EnvC (AmiA/AmiB activator)
MGIFGKALAVVNVVAAIGFVVFAALDYGRRQAWTFAVLEQDFLINGLPVDEDDLDVNGVPVVQSVTARVQQDLFAASRGGTPVKTQIEEVQKRKSDLQAYVGDDPAKWREIVLPLAESSGERAKLYAAGKADVFKARLDQTVNQAMEPTRSGEGSKGFSLGERRQAVARFLFATSRNDDERNRTLAVVGLSAYAQAVTNQANNLQNMIRPYQSAIESDRTAFVVEHNALVQQILALAERVGELQTSLDKQTELLNKHKALRAEREREVKELQNSIASARRAADAALAQQARTEDTTFATQKAVTMAEQKNQDLERILTGLELGR